MEFQLLAPAVLGQKFLVLPSTGSLRPTSLPSSVTPVIQLETSGTLNELRNSPVARSSTKVRPLLFM